MTAVGLQEDAERHNLHEHSLLPVDEVDTYGLLPVDEVDTYGQGSSEVRQNRCFFQTTKWRVAMLGIIVGVVAAASICGLSLRAPRLQGESVDAATQLRSQPKTSCEGKLNLKWQLSKIHLLYDGDVQNQIGLGIAEAFGITSGAHIQQLEIQMSGTSVIVKYTVSTFSQVRLKLSVSTKKMTSCIKTALTSVHVRVTMKVTKIFKPVVEEPHSTSRRRSPPPRSRRRRSPPPSRRRRRSPPPSRRRRSPVTTTITGQLIIQVTTKLTITIKKQITKSICAKFGIKVSALKLKFIVGVGTNVIVKYRIKTTNVVKVTHKIEVCIRRPSILTEYIVKVLTKVHISIYIQVVTIVIDKPTTDVVPPSPPPLQCPPDVIRTRPPTPPPTANPNPVKICHWFGDPYMYNFGANSWFPAFETGKFWIVKSREVKVQGLFCGFYDPHTDKCTGGSHSLTYGLAISGSWFGGKVLVLEPTTGNVYVNRKVVARGTADFQLHLGIADVRQTQGGTMCIVTVQQHDFRFEINRAARDPDPKWAAQGNFINVPALSMRPINGQSGYCTGPGDWKVTRDDLFTSISDYEIQHTSDPRPPCPEKLPRGASQEDVRKACTICAQRMPLGATVADVEACAFDVCTMDSEGMVEPAKETWEQWDKVAEPQTQPPKPQPQPRPQPPTQPITGSCPGHSFRTTASINTWCLVRENCGCSGGDPAIQGANPTLLNSGLRWSGGDTVCLPSGCTAAPACNRGPGVCR